MLKKSERGGKKARPAREPPEERTKGRRGREHYGNGVTNGNKKKSSKETGWGRGEKQAKTPLRPATGLTAVFKIRGTALEKKSIHQRGKGKRCAGATDRAY